MGAAYHYSARGLHPMRRRGGITQVPSGKSMAEKYSVYRDTQAFTKDAVQADERLHCSNSSGIFTSYPVIVLQRDQARALSRFLADTDLGG